MLGPCISVTCLRSHQWLVLVAERTCAALHTNSRACETEDALFGSLPFGSTGPLFSSVSAGFHIRMTGERGHSSPEDFCPVLQSPPPLPSHEFHSIFHVASTGMLPTELQVLNFRFYFYYLVILVPQKPLFTQGNTQLLYLSHPGEGSSVLLASVHEGWARPFMKFPVSYEGCYSDILPYQHTLL